MGIFERFLSLWIALAIGAGVALGALFPGAAAAIEALQVAVAVSISLFGLNSGAALATVVGVLVEVPVMLSLVGIANRNAALFPYRAS